MTPTVPAEGLLYAALSSITFIPLAISFALAAALLLLSPEKSTRRRAHLTLALCILYTVCQLEFISRMLYGVAEPAEWLWCLIDPLTFVVIALSLHAPLKQYTHAIRKTPDPQ